MRDDTVCEKCDGTEGPAIIAASIVVPIVVVGVPLIVMRLERARVYAYRLYNRWFDIGKFKVVWVNVRSRARRHLACARAYFAPSPSMQSCAASAGISTSSSLNRFGRSRISSRSSNSRC